MGYRWVLQEEFSDEFNGNKLDTKKWNDYYPGWEGRSPARFEKSAVSVSNGNLAIKSGVLDKPKGRYTIFGGAVTSKSHDAHFGYYECRAKASKIAMSTTFWMSNGKVPFLPTDSNDDQYSQELDIQEAVGGGTVYDKFRKGMNSNTHYRYIKSGARRETFISKGAGTTLNSEVSDEYHTYAAWWKNAEEVFFYADNRFFESVKISKEISETPFDRPMHINMVTETYNWQPAPSNEDLLNDDINTAYYDWVRSYKLVPVNEEYDHPKTEVTIFPNEVSLDHVDHSIFGSESLNFNYQFSCNENCLLRFSIIEGKEKVLQTKEVNAFFGLGKNDIKIHLNFKPEKEKSYKLTAELIAIESDKTVDVVTFDVSR